MVNFTEIAELFHDEVSELFVERLRDNGFDYLPQYPLTSSFEQALKNYHLLNGLSQEELEEIDWGIRNAVIDASETVLIKYLVEIGYMKEGEEEQNKHFLNSFSFCSIVLGDEENYVSLELRSIKRFLISLSVGTFSNPKRLMVELKRCLKDSVGTFVRAC